MSFATLPMYDWPEAREEVDQEWITIRDALRAQGIDAPDCLARTNTDLPPVPDDVHGKEDSPMISDHGSLPPDELDLMTAWQHPQVLITQTCWGPMEQGLERHVIVVGQPDYSGFEGGEGELYSSAILMRRDSAPESSPAPLKDLLSFLENKRLAFNSPDSMSGILSLSRDLQSVNSSLAIFSDKIETGGHRASIKAVADCKADVCAVDCRTWDLAKRFETKAGELRVIGWTARRKGLPFVTSRERKLEEVQRIKKALKC
jgi:ABC-type phosphate/phosphonate transport system substrate-binding protein